VNDQEPQFSSAYGEAMFYAHVIEDLLALHVYECGYFHVNDYSGLTRRQIRDLTHEQRIDELAKIYQNQNPEEIAQLISALHLLRKIRNHLTHAFIPQVGSDLTTEEGVDQIVAMLNHIATWERLYLKSLQKAHEAVLRGAVSHCLDAVLKREDAPFDARVARSKIQQYLDELKSHLKA
jgi:hypothetical protein